MIDNRELRLALAMRGGVSLAVWIGGCVEEIDQFRWKIGNTEPENAVARLAQAVGFERVTIDVMSGASAGGLNAVIYGAALAVGTPVQELRTTWMKVADMQQLQRRAGWHPHDKQLSLLDGDYFRSQLRSQLARVMAGADVQGDPAMQQDRIDVLLSVTSVLPTDAVTTLDPAFPETEQRIEAQVHLYHRAAPGPSDFIEPDRDSDGQLDRLTLLTQAGRATAAFPFAFAPERPGPRLRERIEMRPRKPQELQLYDGGVTDNMPVGKAARLIESAPADGPTNRVLLYFYPSPDVQDPQAATRALAAAASIKDHGARALDVLRSAIRALRVKTLADDQRAITAHNEKISATREARDGLLALPAGTRQVVARDDLDAARLVDLLISPWEHLDGLVPAPDVQPRLEGKDEAYVDDLVGDVELELRAQAPVLDPALLLPGLSVGSARPWSSVIRVASLLIEWSNGLESDDARVGEAKSELYDVRAAAFAAASELDLKTLRDLENDLAAEVPLSAHRLVEARRARVVPSVVASAASAWRSVVKAAAKIRVVPTDATLPDASRQLHVALRDALPMAAAQAVIDDVTADGSVSLSQLRLLSDALDLVDQRLLPLHLGAPTGNTSRIEYHTVSGRAESPLAACFEWPSAVKGAVDALELPTLLKLKRAEQPGQAGSQIAPGTKLAGNQLHNFSAFLDDSYRANDWMWGQADAACGLIDVLLEPSRRRALTATQVGMIVRGTGTGAPAQTGARVEIDAMGARLWSAVAGAVADELADQQTLRPCPVTRAALLWRRQAEIFGSERVDTVAGSSPPTFKTAFATWDAEPRDLDSEWGQPKLSAIGMRTTSVATRELFARGGRALQVLRFAISPIVVLASSAFLGRHRTVLAVQLFMLGVVLPRSHNSLLGRSLVTAIVIGLAAVGASKLKRNRDHDWHDRVPTRWAWGTVAAAFVAPILAVTVDMGWLDSWLPTFATGSGWWSLGEGSARRLLLPAATAAAATWIYWFWARPVPRVVVTLLNAFVAGFWVAFAARGDDVWPWSRPFESFWWPTLLVIPMIASVLLTVWDVCQFEPNHD